MFVSTREKWIQFKAFTNLFEVREQAGKIPSFRTNVRPRVIVCRSAAVVDHPIDTTSTSDQFRLRERYNTVAKFGLRGCFDVPCIFEVLRKSIA